MNKEDLQEFNSFLQNAKVLSNMDFSQMFKTGQNLLRWRQSSEVEAKAREERIKELDSANNLKNKELLAARADILEKQREIQDLKDRNEALRKGIWPNGFLDSPLVALRMALEDELTKANPSPEAQAVMGALYHLFSCLPKGAAIDASVDFSEAFYAWAYARGDSNALLDGRNAIAEWLSKQLQLSRISVKTLDVGASYNDRFHSRQGTGLKIVQVHSFLFLREDGTAYKKALVTT